MSRFTIIVVFIFVVVILHYVFVLLLAPFFVFLYRIIVHIFFHCVFLMPFFLYIFCFELVFLHHLSSSTRIVFLYWLIFCGLVVVVSIVHIFFCPAQKIKTLTALLFFR